MAILQKRSLTSGSIPTTSSLAVGEIAMNVPDGRIYLRKSGSGSDTIQSAITTGAQNSGSIFLTGSLSISGTGSVFDVAGDVLEFSGDQMEFTGSFVTSGSMKVTGSLSVSVGTVEFSGDQMEFTGSFITSGSLRVIGDTTITGSLRVSGSITGSLLGTASLATTASFAISSSFATTASFATSASWSTSQFPYTGSAIISGSLTVTGSVNVTGSFSISGSRSELFRVTDVTGSGGTLATISSGSIITYNFTTSSLLISGSVVANVQTNQLIFGVVTASVSVDQNDFSPTGWNNTDPSKATTLDISGSRSVKITGLAGGTNGRIAILRNSSPDRLIILEDNSVSSATANRFDFRNPVFLIPNSTIHLMYDSISSKWEPLGSSDGIGLNEYFDQFDDFMGGSPNTTTGIQAGVWTATFSGTGVTPAASTYLIDTTEKPLGIVQMSTGTTATGRGNIGAADASIIPQQGQAICLSRVAVQTNLSTTTDAYHIYSGWHNATGASSASNAVAWQYHTGSAAGTRGASGPNWTAVAISASTYTSSSTGPTVDTNYIWLGTYVSPTWNRATYFYSTDSITWTVATEISSSLPVSASTLGFGVHIGKMVGTTARLNSVDLIGHRYDIIRG